jgi:D-alanyl-D-alanine carboxypeptidase
MLAIEKDHRLASRRLWFLTALLLGLLLMQFGHGLYERGVLGLRPEATCDGKRPPWLGDLEVLASSLGFPGFQLAILERDGGAILCASGWATLDFPPQRMTNGHRLMYASLSKVFTSIITLQLVDEGALSLNDKLVDVLEVRPPYVDPRVADISLGHLLSHRGGFDRNVTPDPMLTASPWCPADSNRLKNWHLDFAPGTRFVYANLGYCLTGAVIERLDGQPLAASIQKRLFNRLGVDGVVQFSGYFDSMLAVPRFDFVEAKASLLQFDWPSMVATGAWAGSADDFIRVLKGAFYFGAGDAPLLTQAARDVILAEDAGCDASRWRQCHGLLFYIHQTNPASAAMHWRDGSLPGATGFAAIYEDGRMLVFLANFRRGNWMPDNDQLGQFFALVQ